MRILIVDDEALARQRLRDLLAECRDAGGQGFEVSEAATAQQAMDHLQQHRCDLMLLDIHMPGTDGLTLAQRVLAVQPPPAVVFVTAHAEHALQAFDLFALDYLTKPVRAERLQQALDKVGRWLARSVPAAAATVPAGPPTGLLIHDRGRTERVALDDVVYLKAELKYVTVRTAQRSFIYDGSLHELEQLHGARWLRVHRNALVARHCIRALEKGHEGGGGATVDDWGPDGHDGWWLRLDGVDERLAVSRRQLAAVREALATGAC